MTVLAQLSRIATHRKRLRALPPGPPEPSLAQTLRWITQPVSFLERARARYGETFTMRLVGVDPFVSFSDPEAIKDIFTGPPEQLSAGEANAVLEPILGQHSVLLLDGPRHMRQRRLLLPPFHGQRMRAYGATIRDVTLSSLARWPRDRPFAVHPFTQAITLEVILRTVFGVSDGAELGALRASLAELLDRVANPLLLLRPAQADLGPWSPGGRLTRILERVEAQLFSIIRAARAADRKGREDVLAMLLDARHEDGSPMDDRELRDELLTLLVAGHETTATSLAWTFQRLLDAPAVLARAVQEVDDAAEDGQVEGELPWIQAITKETLRLNPVVPLVGRRLRAPMRFGGVSLPEGVVAVPNIYLTHRNPRVWPDPERFDPTRFLEAKPSPYAFFPFGGGVRRCIGMAFALYEMKVVLATVLSELSIHSAPGYRPRLVRRAITFAPSEGMPLVVRARTRSSIRGSVPEPASPTTEHSNAGRDGRRRDGR